MPASPGELLHIVEAQGLALRRARLAPADAVSAAAPFRALGDPVRLGLALALAGGLELCVCDLSWIVERPQNLTSHHMKALRSAGLVSARREGKMTMYRLTGSGRTLIDAIRGPGARP